MAPRLQLQAVLKEIAGVAYFQPPSNVTMKFPCIKYERSGDDTKFAGNQPYSLVKQYQVTVIDQNPDSSLPDQVEELPYCRFDRFYAAENLNHWVFTLFF